MDLVEWPIVQMVCGIGLADRLNVVSRRRGGHMRPQNALKIIVAGTVLPRNAACLAHDLSSSAKYRDWMESDSLRALELT
jgi:hypothetical protein